MAVDLLVGAIKFYPFPERVFSRSALLLDAGKKKLHKKGEQISR
jgi:hypothetical protein